MIFALINSEIPANKMTPACIDIATNDRPTASLDAQFLELLFQFVHFLLNSLLTKYILEIEQALDLAAQVVGLLLLIIHGIPFPSR